MKFAIKKVLFLINLMVNWQKAYKNGMFIMYGENSMIERVGRENIFHRVSIRKYEDRPVEDEKIEQENRYHEDYVHLIR